MKDLKFQLNKFKYCCSNYKKTLRVYSKNASLLGLNWAIDDFKTFNESRKIQNWNFDLSLLFVLFFKHYNYFNHFII